MSKTITVFNQVGIYTGPSPSTGYSFITPDGVPNNNYNIVDNTNINLLFPLHRITSFNYSITPQRTEVRNLGYLSNISRPILVPPEVNINFSYYNMGVINELRLGFYVNHPSGSITGAPLYGNDGLIDLSDESGNFLITEDSNNNLLVTSGMTILNAPLISGFYDRKFNASPDTLQGWPLTYRDSRNLYVAIRNDMFDLIDPLNSSSTLNNQIGVLSFGDCFLTSYKTTCAVGQFPLTSLQYVGDNFIYYSSGSGNNIPALNSQTYNLYSGVYFNIPNPDNEENLPTVLFPTNIVLSITENNSNNPSNYPFDFTDIKIQNYQISMNLTRDYLYGIGNVLPLDKRLKFPIISDLSFDVILGQPQAGDLMDLIKRDTTYNITISLNYDKNQPLSGAAIQYMFLGAKFNGFAPQLSISNYETSTLSFTTELDVQNPQNGFFMSGQLGLLNYNPYTSLSSYLDINSSGDRLLFQDNSIFTIYPSGNNTSIVY